MEISIKSDGIRHSEDSGSVGRVLYAEECHKFEYLEGKVKSLTIQGDSSRCAIVTLTGLSFFENIGTCRLWSVDYVG